MDPISLTAYARRRHVSPEAVSKAIKAGRLRHSVVMVDGQPKIANAELADVEWQARTRQRVDRKPRVADGDVAAERGRDPGPGGPPPTLRAGGVPEYQESRARLEAARAALALMELQEKKGKLVRVEVARTAVTEKFVAVRTRLLGLPTRLRQRLPHLTPEDMRTIDAAIREALEELADGKG